MVGNTRHAGKLALDYKEVLDRYHVNIFLDLKRVKVALDKLVELSQSRR